MLVVLAFTQLVLILGVPKVTDTYSGEIATQPNSPTGTSISGPSPSTLIAPTPSSKSGSMTTRASSTNTTHGSSSTASASSGVKSSRTRFSNGGVAGVVVGVLSIALAICIAA